MISWIHELTMSWQHAFDRSHKCIYKYIEMDQTDLLIEAAEEWSKSNAFVDNNKSFKIIYATGSHQQKNRRVRQTSEDNEQSKGLPSY